MTNGWIPAWAGVVWTIAFVVVFAVHFRHVVVSTGRTRFWHLTHSLMAVGMADMVAPAHRMPALDRLGAVVFAAATVAVAGYAVVDSLDRRRVSVVWSAAAVGLAAMVYMYGAAERLSVPVTAVLAAWCAVEAVAWSTGVLGAAARREGLGRASPPRVHELDLAAVGAHELATPGETPPALVVRARAPDEVERWPMRLTLAVSAAGMAYLLLAMQFGMATTEPMTHM